MSLFNYMRQQALAPNSPDGLHIDPMYNYGAGADGPGTLSGYAGVDPNHRNVGDSYNIYNADGSFGQKARLDSGENGFSKLIDVGTMGALAFAGGSAAMGAAGAGAGSGAATLSGMDMAGDGAAGMSYGMGGAVPSAVTTGGAMGTSLAPIGDGLAGPTLSKAALDGTTAFGANSAAGAYSLAGGLGGLGTAISSAVSGVTPGQAMSGAGLANSLFSGGKDSVASGLAGVLGGMYGNNQQQKASNDMLNYLKSRQQMNDNMYAPGTPEYNALFDKMSAQDAAAGRNSQYGTRSIDLAAKIAQLKMDANTRLTGQIARNYGDALNQKAGAYSNIMGPLGQLLGNPQAIGGISNLLNGIGSNGLSNDLVSNGPDMSYSYDPNATTSLDSGVSQAMTNYGIDPSLGWSI